MDSKEKYTAVLIVVFVLVVALIGGGLLLKSQRGDESLDEENESVTETDEADPAADVVVTLEEFCDYQSLTCVEIGSTIKKLKQEYGKNLNVVFRNLPLPANKNALPAAHAAEAARMQSRFWEMHDLLYARQGEWKDEENPREKFLQFARELGIDAERFTRDMDSEQVRSRLEADKDAALALSLQEIPAIVIDGRRLKTDAMTADGIREGVELMLTRGVEDPATRTP